MAGLPREILKWLQTLDLSYSIKNPQRDFASGFLVGEILSRYDSHAAHPHAFDSGTQFKRKQINWEHLERVFKSMKLDIRKTDYEPVMHMAPGAAIALIISLYNSLMHKELKYSKKPQTISELPAYARPTALQVLRDRELQRVPDKKTRDSLLKTALRDHNDKLKLEKTEPGRLAPRQLHSSAEPPPLRPAQSLEEPIAVKEVEVKTMDKNFRTARAFQVRTSEAKDYSKDPHFQIARPVFEVLSEGIAEVLSLTVFKGVRGTHFREVEQGEETTKQFLRKLESFEEDFLKRVGEALQALVGTVADSLLKSAQEFKLWSTLMAEALNSVKSDSLGQKHLGELLESTGQALLERNAYLAEQLFADFFLEPLGALLSESNEKLQIVAMVLRCFSEGFPLIRLRYLSRLLDCTGSYPKLLAVISQLVPTETERTEDLCMYYNYYAVLGLQHTSPVVRTAAISILASLAVLNSELVFKQLSHITPLKHDN